MNTAKKRQHQPPKYFILHKLGRGTFSSIYLAVDLHACSVLRQNYQERRRYIHTNKVNVHHHHQEEEEDFYSLVERKCLVALKCEVTDFSNSGITEVEATILEFLSSEMPSLVPDYKGLVDSHSVLQYLSPSTIPPMLGHRRNQIIKVLAMELLRGEDLHNLRDRTLRELWAKEHKNNNNSNNNNSHNSDCKKSRTGSAEDDMSMSSEDEEDKKLKAEAELMFKYKRQLRPREALKIVCKILNILRSMHALGLVHRDVKPSNFVRSTSSSKDSCWKVVDFGLTKSFVVTESDPTADTNKPWKSTKKSLPEFKQHQNGNTCSERNVGSILHPAPLIANNGVGTTSTNNIDVTEKKDDEGSEDGYDSDLFEPSPGKQSLNTKTNMNKNENGTTVNNDTTRSKGEGDENFKSTVFYRKPRPRGDAEFRGSSMYASPHIHELEEYCPRDDIYSCIYIFMDLIFGKLPWGKAAVSKDRERVAQIKQEVCLNPSMFATGYSSLVWKSASQLFEHLGSLCYYDFPDYELIEELLNKITEKVEMETATAKFFAINWMGPEHHCYFDAPMAFQLDYSNMLSNGNNVYSFSAFAERLVYDEWQLEYESDKTLLRNQTYRLPNLTHYLEQCVDMISQIDGLKTTYFAKVDKVKRRKVSSMFVLSSVLRSKLRLQMARKLKPTTMANTGERERSSSKR